MTKIGSAQASGSYTNASLESVLSSLEKEQSIKIAYDPKLVESVTVTVSFANISVEDALLEILKNTELTFSKVKMNYYTIQPSNVEWNISGSVRDANGNPIPYAKLRILNSRKGAYCDHEGNYSLSHKSDHAPTVEISALGYKKQRISAASLKQSSNVKLAVDLIDYPEIVVEYLTDGMFTGEVASALSIEPDKLGSVPGTTEPDIFQLVQTIPGINSASATVNEIQIRGGTADQNQLLWDGIPVYQPGHFNGMISSINPNIINRADLYRGVYDPYFGGRASGLIDLHSIEKVPKKTMGSAGINFLQSDLYLATPFSEKVGVMVSGRRSFLNLWPSPTYNSYANRVYQESAIELSEEGSVEGESGETSTQFQTVNNFVYQDLNAKVIYRPNDKNYLSVSGIYANNELNYFTEFLDGTDRESLSNVVSSTSSGIGLKYRRKWNEKWTSLIEMSAAGYDYNFDLSYFELFDDSVSFDEQQAKSNFISHVDVKLNSTYEMDSSNTIDFGYQMTRHQVDYGISFNGEVDSVSSVGSNSAAIHSVQANYIWSNPKWLLKAGVRGSYFTGDNEIYPEPRVHIQYNLNKSWTIKSAFGMQHQFVSQIDQLDDIELGLPNRVWVMADTSEIPVVKGIIGDLGFVFRKKSWLVEVEAYAKEVRNVVSFSDNPTFSSGLLRGDALSMGVDILVKKRWKNLRSWISYSYSQVDYTFLEFSQDAFVAPFNQPHMFRWGNSLKWRNFEFSAALKIATGMPHTPLDEVVLDPSSDPSEGADAYYIDYQTSYSARFDVFHQLDVTVFYNVLNNPDKHWNLKVGASCYNVYNKQNISSRRYELEEIETSGDPIVQAYAVDKYFLGITPNAVIRLELK
ncbi:TonB-dependent receptor [Crocinitomicaceae bacterium]|nr:TonB-dependent receptor [Crocinitomicaceae bacterium]